MTVWAFCGEKDGLFGAPAAGRHTWGLPFSTVSIELESVDQAKALGLSEVDPKSQMSYELAGTLRNETPQGSEEGEGA